MEKLNQKFWSPEKLGCEFKIECKNIWDKFKKTNKSEFDKLGITTLEDFQNYMINQTLLIN